MAKDTKKKTVKAKKNHADIDPPNTTTPEQYQEILDSRSTTVNGASRPRTTFWFIQNTKTGEWASLDEDLSAAPVKAPSDYRVFSFTGYGPKGGFEWGMDVTHHPYLEGKPHIFLTREEQLALLKEQT